MKKEMVVEMVEARSLRLDRTTMDMLKVFQSGYKTQEETIRTLIWRELCERIDGETKYLHTFPDKYNKEIEDFIVEHWEDLGYGSLPSEKKVIDFGEYSLKQKERLARKQENEDQILYSKIRKSYAKFPDTAEFSYSQQASNLIKTMKEDARRQTCLRG